MLFYETFGSPSVEHPYPLIFLHGFLGSRKDWMPIIESLQNSYCCIAIDLPAHGNSEHSENVFLELENTLTFLSSPPPVLIGYSLGGRLALSYAQKHPDKIKGLIACSAHTGLKTTLEKEKRQKQDLIWQGRLKTLPSEEFLTLWYKQSVFSSLQKKPQLLERLLKMRSYQNPIELASVLEQVSLSKQPFYDTFKHPVCFLFGEEDTNYVKLYDTLENTVKIKKTGHMIHLENPMSCLEAIKVFSP